VRQPDLALDEPRPRLRVAADSSAVKPAWSNIILVEDNAARAQRRMLAGVTPRRAAADVAIRIHRVQGNKASVVAEKSYSPGALVGDGQRGGRATVALELLDSLRLRRQGTVVVAGPVYGSNRWFVKGLASRGYEFAVEIRPSTLVWRADNGNGRSARAEALVEDPTWNRFSVAVPGARAEISYGAANLTKVLLPLGRVGRLFAAETGGIDGVHRGTLFGLTSARRATLKKLVEAVGWARWIRPMVRRQERLAREGHAGTAEHGSASGLSRNRMTLTARANIALAQRQDQMAPWSQAQLSLPGYRSRGVFASLSRLGVIELFAGAGGMGLGFLLAGGRRRGYRVVFSGEVNPIFVETLRRNHGAFVGRRSERADHALENIAPIDLRTSDALSHVRRVSREAGGVHILIGGPPCQGFSNANRNSWHSANPHNRLIDVFLRYVESLRPPVFLLENVQGILWTARGSRSTASFRVVEHLAQRMRTAGYEVFPKLLDAVWYGVPQYRSRLFLLGLRRDLGYSRGDFGDWGPFPIPSHGPGCSRPYVTVREAIADLPRIGNGDDVDERRYREPSTRELQRKPFVKLMRSGARRDVILDHVTSKHAKYVIDRYRRIPEGGNWQDIANTLTNYADVQRTHSNIYRRLKWDEPSITIGHYRKSMLVHPSQDRALVDISNPAIRGQAKTGHRASAQAVRVFYRIAT
jgi:DNA-cytosine methyltransferase